MKRYLILITIFTISFFAYQSFAQDKIASETITSFFDALKSGDTDKLLLYIDGPMYKRTKVFLNQNNNYTNLLKTRYENADFFINKISGTDHDELVADILISFPYGNTINKKLILKKNPGEKSWKIIDEIRRGM
jgi:hypothetical protein